jgi:hypothetical protein
MFWRNAGERKTIASLTNEKTKERERRECSTASRPARSGSLAVAGALRMKRAVLGRKGDVKKVKV